MALSLLLYLAVFIAWVFPRQFGGWLAKVHRGYEDARAALRTPEESP